MQRKQIKVGDVLLHQKSRYWNHDGLWDISRATVVAIEPHRLNLNRTEYEPGVPGRYGKASTRDLLVDLEARKNDDSGFHPARRTLVRVADLRGPFDETLAAVQQRRTERQQAAEDGAARRRSVTVAVAKVMDRARADGISSVIDATHWHAVDVRNARVSVSLADFERLVNAAAELRRQSR